MSSKNIAKSVRLVAKVVDENNGPCAFCHRTENDETLYGKLYAIGDIYCHYFCVLLSCCLIQKGEDEDGLLGFLYPDILAELERSKKHKCSHCARHGATLGCAVPQCRKQFHLPCGRERGAVSLYYGNYRSYCAKHSPRQRIPKEVSDKAKRRLGCQRKTGTAELTDASESVCVICYEQVPGYPTRETFWPPCCARDAWFHRSCLERMTLNAGAHYLKCPLCNDKEMFLKAVLGQGYYVPDRDAAWEMDTGAFADMYSRPVRCDAARCLCERGREHDEDNSAWDISLCLLCGQSGSHAACRAPGARYVCPACAPAAPRDLAPLLDKIDTVIEEEEMKSSSPVKRVMTSRMSLRRTKPLAANAQSTSRLACLRKTDAADLDESHHSTTKRSRLDLNLKSPRKPPGLPAAHGGLPVTHGGLPATHSGLPTTHGGLPVTHGELPATHGGLPAAHTGLPMTVHGESPLRALERRLLARGGCTEALEALRSKFNRPRPLCEKRRLVDAIVADFLQESPKARSPVKLWQSPKKLQENMKENIYESIEVTPQKTPPTPVSTPVSTPRVDTPRSPIQPAYDDSSNSTFQLAPEFIGDLSDASLPPFDTPQKLTTVDLTADTSMEVSSQPKNLESFESRYLDEVASFKREHSRERKVFAGKLQSAIDCAIEAATAQKEPVNVTDVSVTGVNVTDVKVTGVNVTDEEKARKRDAKQRRKAKRIRRMKSKNTLKIKLIYKSQSSSKKTVNLTLKSKNKKHNSGGGPKTNVAIPDKDIKLKIKLKNKNAVEKDKSFTQTILNFSPEFASPTKQFIRPSHSVTPKKRKYNKHEKNNDSFKQTSIQNFFNVKTKDDEE